MDLKKSYINLKKKYIELKTKYIDRKKPDKIPEIDLEYMSDSSAAMLEGVPIAYHLILWFSLLFMFVGLIWAKFAVLDVVTVGEGIVIPSGRTQIVQNLEGGIIKQILVSEGQKVIKNQVLMIIDDTRFASSYSETAVQVYAMKAKIARLIAESQGAPLIFDAALRAKYPSYVQNETVLYQDRQKSFNNRLAIQKEQVSQSEQNLLELKGKRDQLTRSLALIKKELALTAPMEKTGAVSEVEVLRLERTVNDVLGDLQATQTSLPKLESMLQADKNKVNELYLTFRSEAGAELTTARSEYNRLFENIKGAEDRLLRTQVRSPVQGTVNQLKVNTLGAVVQPGAELVEIVPDKGNLLIEVRIKPRDIGFLSINLPAIVKISAYDFSIYGGLKAKVEHISSTTIPNEKGDLFYKILVRTTEHNYLRGKSGEKLYISPGMIATVDILTGQKTVLDYILKPILKAKQSAMRER